MRSHTISLESNIIKYNLKGLWYEKNVLKFLGKFQKCFFFKKGISEQYTVENRLPENDSGNKWAQITKLLRPRFKET